MALETINCPHCGQPTNQLVKVETGMRVALQSTGQGANIPEAVCSSCFESFSGKISRGVRLRVEEEAKAKNRIMLWKSRVGLVKQARQLMLQKALPEAAVSYEKYLKVLEMIYEVDRGGLTPDIFSKSTRSKEVTVIVSVYWDLVRIYDSSPRYHDRLLNSIKKLTLFAGYSNIFPDIIKKAEAYVRKAKNPAPFKQFLKNARKSSGRCFIATAAYGSPYVDEVNQLRLYRDFYLKNTTSGRRFIYWYYRLSPPVAKWIDQHPQLKPLIRAALKPTCWLIFSQDNRKMPFETKLTFRGANVRTQKEYTKL